MREQINLKHARDESQFVLIRGYPRRREYIRELEQRYSARLVPDTQPDLIFRLDHYNVRARQETGKWPEFIALETEPLKWFIPIPYEIEVFSLPLIVYNKPAWFSAQRKIGVPIFSWRK